MARRTSGWTVVKRIAREVDRANRANQRAQISHKKAVLRDMEAVVKKATRLQEQFNRTIHAANDATTLATKEAKLLEAKSTLDELTRLGNEHSFITLTNDSGAREGIARIQADVKALQLEQFQKRASEQSALSETAEAQRIRDAIGNLLENCLTYNGVLNWENAKDFTKFSVPEPTKPSQPMLPPHPALDEVPAEPDAKDLKYKPQIPLLTWFSKQKKSLLIAAANQQYAQDLAEWEKEAANIKEANESQLYEWERNKQSLIYAWENSYKTTHDVWKRNKQQFIDAQNEHNAFLPQLKQQYEAHDKGAIEKYCGLILNRSKYPIQFSRDYQLEYLAEAQVLAVDYSLPNIEAVPDLKEAKFIKSKGEIKRTFVTDKQRQDLYDKLLYSIVFRSIYELLSADGINAIQNIVFNGWVNSVDKATGNEANRCILTISVKTDEFKTLNLANIDPKECFKKFKGIGSAKLSELVLVAPIIDLNKNDRRFVQSYNVADKILEGDNLAVMHWEDFEHLIRELFEKEFGANGGEVRVTQASRDGGVDAVIFDPDPIRGGKIVVQAKRYTNTVGVAAVRDLYGTLINEGAMKGILITTSDYGPDAFHFARDKPITLMTGANLLHLLERHGRKARIDLKEAKKAAV